jgi:hypothetical protein
MACVDAWTGLFRQHSCRHCLPNRFAIKTDLNDDDTEIMITQAAAMGTMQYSWVNGNACSVL